MANETDSPTAPRRPFYLVLTIITMWLIGMHSVAEGLFAIDVVRNPATVPGTTTLQYKDIEEAMKGALVLATAKHGRIAMPLGIGELILGGLLVMLSVRALFARRASTSFAIQVLVANILFVIVDYVVSEPLRVSIVNTIVGSGLDELPDFVPEQQRDEMQYLRWWWIFRIQLAIKLAALALSAFAFTRPKVREFLSPTEPHPDEEF